MKLEDLQFHWRISYGFESKLKSVPLSDVTGQIQMVDPELYELAKVFFG